MVIGIKDGAKLVGIIIVCFCASFVCTLFLNYYLDALAVGGSVSEYAAALYDAQIAMAKFVCMITGGALGAIAVVMLAFYIKLFVDGNAKRFGLLKAMGYSDGRLSISFWVFGLAVFIGTILGYGLGCVFMPFIYNEMTIEGMMKIVVSFHVWLPIVIVLAPTVCFSALACCYARFILGRNAVVLLKGPNNHGNVKRVSEKNLPFVSEMRGSVLRSKKSTVFFVAFSCFCFSAMTQMGLSMRDLSTATMGVMISAIGIVLSVTAMIMAVTTVIESNKRNVALMRAFGYSQKERVIAVFSGYIPFAVLGFIVGTLYQYGLLKLMVNVYFKDVAEVPEYSFNVPVFFVTLVVFLVLYTAAMLFYSYRLNKASVKQTMTED